MNEKSEARTPRERAYERVLVHIEEYKKWMVKARSGSKESREQYRQMARREEIMVSTLVEVAKSKPDELEEE